MATIVQRENVRPFIEEICRKPTFIFSVECERRTDLHLRYDPVDLLKNGPLAYKGDASRILDGERIRSCCGVEQPPSRRACSECGVKKAANKIVLEVAGTMRSMVVKGKNDLNATKHWVSKGQEARYDPADHDLMRVAGMYNDSVKNGRIGRFGQWRPWAMICLRTIQRIVYGGETFLIIG